MHRCLEPHALLDRQQEQMECLSAVVKAVPQQLIDKRWRFPMAQTLRKIGYFSVVTPHAAGRGLLVLAALRDAGVNLLAYKGFPSGRQAQLDFVPANPARFRAVARRMKLRISPKKIGFLLQGDDKVGALTAVLSKLAKARVNITALDAVVAGKGRFGAIFWVKPKHVAKTAKLLRAK
jgi:hypothetical protein